MNASCSSHLNLHKSCIVAYTIFDFSSVVLLIIWFEEVEFDFQKLQDGKPVFDTFGKLCMAPAQYFTLPLCYTSISYLHLMMQMPVSSINCSVKTNKRPTKLKVTAFLKL